MLLFTDFGFRFDPNVPGTPRFGFGELVKLLVLACCGQFSRLLVTDFGSLCDPNISGTPGSGYGELVKTRSFGLFWPVLYTITH